MSGLRTLDQLPDVLSQDEFWEAFGRIEHERLDFKRGVPQDVLDTIPAMAMTVKPLSGADQRPEL